jgi:thioesterase domain-containing protein
VLFRSIIPTPFLDLAARAGLIPKDRMTVSALAQVNYKPPFFDSTLTIFRVTERPRFEQSDPLSSWQAYARQVDFIDVPGNHKTVLSEPNVQELARKIRDRLSAAPVSIS